MLGPDLGHSRESFDQRSCHVPSLCPVGPVGVRRRSSCVACGPATVVVYDTGSAGRGATGRSPSRRHAVAPPAPSRRRAGAPRSARGRMTVPGKPASSVVALHLWTDDAGGRAAYRVERHDSRRSPRRSPAHRGPSRPAALSARHDRPATFAQRPRTTHPQPGPASVSPQTPAHLLPGGLRRAACLCGEVCQRIARGPPPCPCGIIGSSLVALRRGCAERSFSR